VLMIQGTVAYQATSPQVYSPDSTCLHPWCTCKKHMTTLHLLSNRDRIGPQGPNWIAVTAPWPWRIVTNHAHDGMSHNLSTKGVCSRLFAIPLQWLHPNTSIAVRNHTFCLKSDNQGAAIFNETQFLQMRLNK